MRGETVSIDPTTLEANAALRSIVRRESGQRYQEYPALPPVEGGARRSSEYHRGSVWEASTLLRPLQPNVPGLGVAIAESASRPAHLQGTELEEKSGSSGL